MLTQLDLESKGQGHSKNQKTMPYWSRGSISNWCDADADANADADAAEDIYKTICRPPPYGGGGGG